MRVGDLALLPAALQHSGRAASTNAHAGGLPPPHRAKHHMCLSGPASIKVSGERNSRGVAELRVLPQGVAHQDSGPFQTFATCQAVVVKSGRITHVSAVSRCAGPAESCSRMDFDFLGRSKCNRARGAALSSAARSSLGSGGRRQGVDAERRTSRSLFKGIAELGWCGTAIPGRGQVLGRGSRYMEPAPSPRSAGRRARAGAFASSIYFLRRRG